MGKFWSKLTGLLEISNNSTNYINKADVRNLPVVESLITKHVPYNKSRGCHGPLLHSLTQS